MSKKQNSKDKFRQSKVWKDWRKTCMIYWGEIDPITKKKLRSGWNLHHCDNRLETYKDLSDPEKFRPLNSKTHSCIEWLWTYWKKDKDIINRIVSLLEEMERLGSV